MKISYGRSMWDKNGTFYSQRIVMTVDEFNRVQDAIQAEMAMGYPTRAKYSTYNCLEDLKAYFKLIHMEKVKFPFMSKEQKLCFLTLTQAKFLQRFKELEGRLKLDRNTYIEII